MNNLALSCQPADRCSRGTVEQLLPSPDVFVSRANGFVRGVAGQTARHVQHSKYKQIICQPEETLCLALKFKMKAGRVPLRRLESTESLQRARRQRRKRKRRIAVILTACAVAVLAATSLASYKFYRRLSKSKRTELMNGRTSPSVSEYPHRPNSSRADFPIVGESKSSLSRVGGDSYSDDEGAERRNPESFDKSMDLTDAFGHSSSSGGNNFNKGGWSDQSQLTDSTDDRWKSVSWPARTLSDLLRLPCSTMAAWNNLYWSNHSGSMWPPTRCSSYPSMCKGGRSQTEEKPHVMRSRLDVTDQLQDSSDVSTEPTGRGSREVRDVGTSTEPGYEGFRSPGTPVSPRHGVAHSLEWPLQFAKYEPRGEPDGCEDPEEC